MADPEPFPDPAPEPVGPFLTLDEARLILHITDPLRDPEITLYLDQATGMVLDYLKQWGDATWTPETAPLVVKAATGRALTYSWEHRGDRPDDGDAVKLWQDLELLLARRRAPTVS